MKLVIRGAIQVKTDEKQQILTASQKLFNEIVKQNRISTKEINALILSQTKDLKSFNAATAIRKLQNGVEDSFPLFCVQETDTEGSMPRVIRIMLFTDRRILSRKNVRHVYIDGAQALRPDLSISDDASNTPALSSL